ncbi:DNA-directed RNA polymerase subunit beta' [Mesoplasma lactucae]|uniref:DNA-directed RNA polymerase subunit beta' n=1 Tax=Mesoplasma lactucae ATCC 49193 TaxID=81460 RepID=A0A291ISF5_9MOLU|nr:DNA-directed RNA polymerase subunit beta' [Mesoplasma lactucae]ATG97658.1 DNA-directed RNA polymerase subunit beta' [Mesoplasma lactucae ATCC 49193]ATZ19877.1 DNA-directed RNA polymerase subunit beta' [Mesoplasma lactucae ATCC 49193]MCL8216740.1 DNA-directed RNA polymerase subunit beta' [Mesoplasma lactucae ATCC 49193]
MQNNKKNKKSIKIELSSPETIRSWSHGEVTKPETINYKTLKAEKDGLFDERIFGPIKNFECACGKYKKANPMNKGKVCEKCGVELTESIVRRERMGHIELEEPVTHIWMLKVAPSRIAAILDLKTKELEEIVYFVSYVVLEAGNSKYLTPKQVLDLDSAKSSAKTREAMLNTLQEEVLDQIEDKESRDARKAKRMIEELKDPSVPFSIEEASDLIAKYTGAKFGIGASAVEYLLQQIDVDKDMAEIKQELKGSTSASDQQKLMKRLEVLDAFHKSGAKPEWMVLHTIPVIPPDIRPIIQLDGGRFTTSEINDLYRRIIIRNERLKKVKAMRAPSIIVNNEKRMLQEAVDALMDNDRKSRPIVGKDKRPLKSLTSTLKGKQGRFRQNLLGKRVDYSGRSVIAIGPDLKMYQAGIPREMAITLFKPFIIEWLQEHDYADNVKAAERMITNNDPKVWDALEQVIKDRPVLLNRAPTLHRLGIQAFEPKIVKGKAMRLHPLVTTAFNADFDGDQMAVHLPITPEAVGEARALMLGSHAILGPKDGKPIVTPTQDMILGNYYVTLEEKGVDGEGMLFANPQEAKTAYDQKVINLNALIAVPVNTLPGHTFTEDQQDKYLMTTVGKILFNEIFARQFPWINTPDITNAEEAVKEYIIDDSTNPMDWIEAHDVQQPIKKKELSKIIERYFNTYDSRSTAEMLDNMKDLGYKFSTKSGTTISAGDVVAYTHKYDEFKEADEKVAQINEFYKEGMLTESEKKQRVIEVWSNVKENIQKELEVILKQDPKNPVFVMSDSGARGNVSNFTQLVGMRGLMNDTKGDIKEIPIKSSFREGLTVSEYFISTHGARKGMADIALKTADSGYLTRRLVDVSQEVVVVAEDCKPTKGFAVSAIVDTKHQNTIVPLKDRLVGRRSFEDIEDKDGNIIVKKDEMFTSELADKVTDAGIETVNIRSVLTCDAERGVCEMCYGIDLATGEEVKYGAPVGVVAAQSIGEPGTQLTMRNFHTGGVAGDADITQGLPRIKELLDVTTPKGSIAMIAKMNGEVTDVQQHEGFSEIFVKSNSGDVEKYKTSYNAIVRVQPGDKVKPGDKLTEGSIDIKNLLDVASVEAVQNYILKEVQKVYRLQGIEIADKYIEIIVKQMLGKVKVTDAGDTDLLPGEVVSQKRFRNAVKWAFENNKQAPLAKPVIFGIKKAPLESESWLSSASFQDTARVLAKAIVRGQEDHLEGLKENIMLGNLIPAGTGLTGAKEVMEIGEEYHRNEY